MTEPDCIVVLAMPPEGVIWVSFKRVWRSIKMGDEGGVDGGVDENRRKVGGRTVWSCKGGF